MPERKAQGTTGLELRPTHGQQDVTRLRHTGLAGRAGGTLDPGGVQQIKQGVPVTSGNQQVRVARQTPYAVTGLPVPGHLNPEAGIHGTANQLVAQGNQASGDYRPVGCGVAHGHGTAPDSRDVQGAAAHLTLLSSPVGQRHEGGIAPGQ